jgi:hypothetical protein
MRVYPSLRLYCLVLSEHKHYTLCAGQIPLM